MAYNFKSIADVETVEKVENSANMLIEENGIIKKVPKTAISSNNDRYDIIFYYHNHEDIVEVLHGDCSYDNIVNKIALHEPLFVGFMYTGLGSPSHYTQMICTSIHHTTWGEEGYITFSFYDHGNAHSITLYPDNTLTYGE